MKGARRKAGAREQFEAKMEEKQKVIKTKWYLHGEEKKSSDKVSVVLYGFSESDPLNRFGSASGEERDHPPSLYRYEWRVRDKVNK
jgi:hypothetical protein